MAKSGVRSAVSHAHDCAAAGMVPGMVKDGDGGVLNLTTRERKEKDQTT